MPNLKQLRGQAQQSELGKKIHRYALKMATSGAYMDMIDAQIFAYKCHVSIGVLMDSAVHAELHVVSVTDYWQSLLDSSVELPSVPQGADALASWVLVSCNAAYDPSAQTNHWLPGWRRENMSEDAFFDLTTAEQSATSVILNQKNQELMELQGEVLDEDLDDIQKTERLSAVSECELEIEKLLGQCVKLSSPCFECFCVVFWPFAFYIVFLSL